MDARKYYPDQAIAQLEQGDVTLLVKSFDKKGKLLSQRGEVRTIEVPRAADSDAPAVPMIVLPATVVTRPPAVRVRFVVRTEGTGKLGASNFFLTDDRNPGEPAK